MLVACSPPSWRFRFCFRSFERNARIFAGGSHASLHALFNSFETWHYRKAILPASRTAGPSPDCFRCTPKLLVASYIADITIEILFLPETAFARQLGRAEQPCRESCEASIV